MALQGARIVEQLEREAEDAEQRERIARAAAQTAVVTQFYYYHPAERKARAREALRRIVESAFRRDEGDGMIDVFLEGLWNIMSGNNDV